MPLKEKCVVTHSPVGMRVMEHQAGPLGSTTADQEAEAGERRQHGLQLVSHGRGKAGKERWLRIGKFE